MTRALPSAVVSDDVPQQADAAGAQQSERTAIRDSARGDAAIASPHHFFDLRGVHRSCTPFPGSCGFTALRHVAWQAAGGEVSPAAVLAEVTEQRAHSRVFGRVDQRSAITRA